MFNFNNNLSKNPAARDFSASQQDYAVFLPSISAIYAYIVSMDTYKMRDQLPAGLANGLKDLDFLDPTNNMFYYPAALYSAGHAVLDVNESYTAERMIQQRDRANTVMVGDSGGFQAATGVLKFPWTAKKNQSAQDHVQDQDAFRMQILKWLEATADYSMLLDWPPFSMTKAGFDPTTGISYHPGLKSFADCLNGTLENHKFFIKHRTPGATKFMNVLQGLNITEGDIWWEAVKDLPFEAWAFGGFQGHNFAFNIRRLIIMRDTGYLQGREWLHYLGNGKIKAACAMTTLQRTLRKHVDPELTISFDAASPFVMTAKGQIYYGQLHSPNKLGFKGGSMPDDKNFKGSKLLLNDWIAQMSGAATDVRSRMGDSVSLGDICVRGYQDLEYKKIAWSKKELQDGTYACSPEAAANDRFKWSRAYKEYLTHSVHNGGAFDFGNQDFTLEYEKYQVKWPSSMDGFSYLLAMNHNTEIHINAIQAACHWQDQPLHIATNYIPQDLLEFKDICEEIFTSETPMDIINRHEVLLRNITGIDAEMSMSIDLDSLV